MKTVWINILFFYDHDLIFCFKHEVRLLLWMIFDNEKPENENIKKKSDDDFKVIKSNVSVKCNPQYVVSI